MNLRGVRAVFFDVGGTLLHPWPSVGAVYAEVGARHGFHASADAMEQAFRIAWKPAHGLTMADKAWWRHLVFGTLDSLGLTGTPPQREAYFEELYEVFAQPAAWRLYPDVLDTLRGARMLGWHLGVISNWDARLRPLLHALSLSQWLDSMTISCEVGSEKPRPDIFIAALHTADVKPGEALHVGDSVEIDVRGAEAVQMRALLIDRQGSECRACPVIHDLREILGQTQ